MPLRLTAFLAGLTLLLAAGQATAQFPQVSLSGGVTATATASVPLTPSALRLTMWVKAQGSDATSAISMLNEHKKRVTKELTGMRADGDSIRFSAVRIQKGSGGDERQMRSMQRQMMRQSGGSAPAAPPTVYTAQAAVVADWKLDGIKGDALALLPTTLKEQIIARDIAGKKNKPKLDEAAQEQLDEMEEMMQEQYNGYYDSDQGGQGPQVQFIASIDLKQRKQATQTAFQSAKEEALTLAEAAGGQLGKLTNISRMSQDQTYNTRMMGYSSPTQFPSTLAKADDEVAAATVDELKDTLAITVSYALKE